MAKKVIKKIKVQVPGGKAVPNQQLGPALGQAGINIGDFIQKVNAASAQMVGDIVPVEISVYEDRTYDFVLKTPPASRLLLKALGKEKGSGKNAASKAGTLARKQVEEIAARKLVDLNTTDLAAATRIIEGTAKSMGIEVK